MTECTHRLPLQLIHDMIITCTSVTCVRVWSTLDATVDLHAWLGIDLRENRLVVQHMTLCYLPASTQAASPQHDSAPVQPAGHPYAVPSGGSGGGGQGGGRGGRRVAQDSHHPRHLQSVNSSPCRQPGVSCAGPGWACIPLSTLPSSSHLSLRHCIGQPNVFHSECV